MKNLEKTIKSLTMIIKANTNYSNYFTKKNEVKIILKNAISIISDLLNGENVFVYTSYGKGKFTKYNFKIDARLAINILKELFNIDVETGNNSTSHCAKYGEFIWLSDKQKDILLSL